MIGAQVAASRSLSGGRSMLRGHTRWLAVAAVLVACTGTTQVISHAQSAKPKGTLIAPAVPAAKADPRVAKLKEDVAADIRSQAMFDLGQKMTDQVFSFG